MPHGPPSVYTVLWAALMNRESLKDAAASASQAPPVKITKLHNTTTKTVENTLKRWIAGKTQRHLSVSLSMIYTKACVLSSEFKECQEDFSGQRFNGSHGWFLHSVWCVGLKNIRFTGGASSANVQATQVLPASFKPTAQNSGVSNQVFSSE